MEEVQYKNLAVKIPVKCAVTEQASALHSLHVDTWFYGQRLSGAGRGWAGLLKYPFPRRLSGKLKEHTEHLHRTWHSVKTHNQRHPFSLVVL